jgi:hypothetical protein
MTRSTPCFCRPTEKRSFSLFFDVKNPMKVGVTALRLGGVDDANPPLGQTPGEHPSAQCGFGHGGSAVLATSRGMLLDLSQAAREAVQLGEGPSGATARGGHLVHQRQSERVRDLEGAQSPWMDRMCGVGNGGCTLRTRQRSKALELGCFSPALVIASPGNGWRGRETKRADSGACCSQRASHPGALCSPPGHRRSRTPRGVGEVATQVFHSFAVDGRGLRARSYLDADFLAMLRLRPRQRIRHFDLGSPSPHLV